MGSTYVISDTHFNDQSVLSEFNRPFVSVDEMNDTLLSQWNQCVDICDKVIFVGDLAKSTDENDLWFWLTQLNGEIIYIDGNHDPVPRSEFSESNLPLKTSYKFECSGYEFYCAHKLEWVPDNWSGWTIHGHYHNRYPDKYPFIDVSKQRINVCVEMIEYSPVRVSELIELIERDVSYKTYADIK